MKISDQHRSFLNKRGISDSIIDAFSISTQDVPYLKLSDAITIPVHNIDGTFSFNKYRRCPLEGDVKPKYLYDRGGKVTLYGADKLTVADSMSSGPVVITEGELDTLVCWSLGIPAVSSTGGAKSFQEDWAQLLRYKSLDIYICFDNDKAGHEGAIKVLDLIPDAKVIFIPSNIPGVKDVSDFVAHGGDFHSLMRSAHSFTDLAAVEEENQIIAGRWGDNSFHRAYIEHHKVKNMPTNVAGNANRKTYNGDDKRLRAKDVDCLTLLPFERSGHYPVTKCLWHNDNDPSLTYYKRTNSCYCHVCGKYADSIDIVMMRDGVRMPDAINKLVK